MTSELVSESMPEEEHVIQHPYHSRTAEKKQPPPHNVIKITGDDTYEVLDGQRSGSHKSFYSLIKNIKILIDIFDKACYAKNVKNINFIKGGTAMTKIYRNNIKRIFFSKCSMSIVWNYYRNLKSKISKSMILSYG